MTDLAIETTTMPRHSMARNLAHLIERMQTSDDPEVTVEFYEAVEHAGEQFKDHLQDVCDVIDTLEATCVGIEHVIAKQQALLLERSARAERLKSLVQSWMETIGVKELLLPHNTLRCVLNPPAVEVKDETLIPDEYMRQPPRPPQPPKAPDKNAIKEAFKYGAVVPGCEITQKTRLEIK